LTKTHAREVYNAVDHDVKLFMKVVLARLKGADEVIDKALNKVHDLNR
jgi:hypothetical protein